MTSDPRAGFSRRLGRPLIQVVVLIALALAVYSNTFRVPFVFDDVSSITENPEIQHLSNFLPGGTGFSERPNRCIGYLSFALNYYFGGLDVAGYHLVNLAIHIVNGLLVYALVTLTLRSTFFAERTGEDQGAETAQHSFSGWSRFLPFLAALMFVIHPVQTQAVTYVVQRLTSLATLFYLGALVSYVKWRLASARGADFASRSVLPFWLLSLLSAVLAMKTKEIAFTLPFVALLYEWCFFGRPNRRRLALLAPLLMTAVIIPLSMINVLKPVDQLLTDVSSATVAEPTLSRWEYLCTQFSVIVTYLRLLVLPIDQNLDYAYPINRTILAPRALCSLTILLTLVAAALYLFHLSSKKNRDTSSTGNTSKVPGDSGTGPARSSITICTSRLTAFGIFWFFITLSVESSIIPITDIIFEHRLYLPSVGFFLAAAALASAILAKTRVRNLAAANLTAGVLMAAVLILAGTAYARNGVWENWETIWRDVISKNPKSARAYNNLGTYYGNQRRYGDAITEFEEAARLYPRYLDAHFNLGRAFVVVGRYEEAAREFRTTLAISPAHPEAKEFLAQLEVLLRNGKSYGRTSAFNQH